MKQELIDKYNVSVPRYTSYPPANFFRPFTGEESLKEVDYSNEVREKNLSFYFHMPFCRRLCHYCGCNSYPMAKEERVAEYVQALHKEIDLVAAHLDKSRRISQIHYGGGSPTAMPVSVLKELNEHLLSLFSTIEQPEIAIECHPGYLTSKDWQGLLDARFNRFSLGIQDFNEDVLRLVNRTPSELPTEEIVAILRNAGVSLNMDFLFGLPLQTSDSFKTTIERAVAMRPDRVTTFSYGHCPWIFKRQMILEKAGLPSAEEKALMFQKAKEVLHEAGYLSVGLDHFVLPNDELSEALRSHRLHRNFQGYTTQEECDLLGMGVSAISLLGDTYAQNHKELKQYYAEIEERGIALHKGLALSQDDCIRRDVIKALICNFKLDFDRLSESYHINFNEYFAEDLALLQPLAEDGLLTLTDKSIVVSPRGRLLIRNICLCFDVYSRQLAKRQQFSRII